MGVMKCSWIQFYEIKLLDKDCVITISELYGGHTYPQPR